MKNIVVIVIIFFGISVLGQDAPFSVMVVDFKENPIEGEQILFRGIKTKKIFKGVTNKDGRFEIEVPGGDTYEIKIKSIGDAKEYNTLEIPAIQEGYSYNKGTLTVMIDEPKFFTLDNVYFDSGKATLKSSSYKELNELLEYLTLKPATVIEIAGHTDDVGEETANITLSQKRADAVKKYLLNKGISSNRVTAKGYGESRPISDNSTDKGRAKNRRTEVHIKN